MPKPKHLQTCSLDLKSLFHAFLQRKISPVWSKDGRIGDGPRSQHRGLLSCLLKTMVLAETVPEQIWKGTEPVLILWRLKPVDPPKPSSFTQFYVILVHLGKFWDIFRASPSKESGPRSWGDGVLTDLEGDRASSDSLEVKACRPIKTQ